MSTATAPEKRAARPVKLWTGEEALAKPFRVRVSDRVLADIYGNNRRKRLSATSFSYLFLNTTEGQRSR